MNTEDLLTRKELAQKIRVSVITIQRYQKKGMPVIRIGNSPRYNYSDILDWFVNFKPVRE